MLLIIIKLNLIFIELNKNNKILIKKRIIWKIIIKNLLTNRLM